jgi:hypothetical protein
VVGLLSLSFHTECVPAFSSALMLVILLKDGCLNIFNKQRITYEGQVDECVGEVIGGISHTLRWNL